jgi:adenylate cyclase class 2
MKIEIECKIPVSTHDPVRAALRRCGATYVGRVLETNHFLDDADRSLQQGGSGLRVREVQTLDGSGGRATVTCKGPLRDAAFKQREEIETEIGDADAMLRLLARLGYRVYLVFAKRRESWSLPPCLVELDELPRMGDFVEVEGPGESEIRRVVDVLGLDASRSTTKGYASMVVEQFESVGDEVLRLSFD